MNGLRLQLCADPGEYVAAAGDHNAVAEVSHPIQADGARACLFTDQANPTSDKIHTALGYRPVADTANLVIVRCRIPSDPLQLAEKGVRQ